jgi:two-component system OmpR family response regulator
VRVLVVDDDERLARALARGLRDDGLAVDVALTGGDGWWLAGQASYDAIVLDVMLPGMSGLELCGRLRAAGEWAPILILTALTEREDEVRALDVGADDFLTKPFGYEVLLARLRALRRRGRAQRPTTLRAGDLSLDPATRRVTRAGTPVELTPRQFALLELLMGSPGVVLSRQQILEHVWDFAFDGDPNIVEVYVSQLRRRIDQPFGASSVQTVRGVGYRLAPDGGRP